MVRNLLVVMGLVVGLTGCGLAPVKYNLATSKAQSMRNRDVTVYTVIPKRRGLYNEIYLHEEKYGYSGDEYETIFRYPGMDWVRMKRGIDAERIDISQDWIDYQEEFAQAVADYLKSEKSYSATFNGSLDKDEVYDSKPMQYALNSNELKSIKEYVENNKGTDEVGIFIYSNIEIMRTNLNDKVRVVNYVPGFDIYDMQNGARLGRFSHVKGFKRDYEKLTIDEVESLGIKYDKRKHGYVRAESTDDFYKRIITALFSSF